MRSMETFIELLQGEVDLKPSGNVESKYSANDIKAGFLEIVELSTIPLENIAFAHVAGSYSRDEQTPYSDVDIECFSPNMKEYQDTYTWNGLLISFAIYPVDSVRGEGTNIVDRSWARSCFKNSKPIYDPENQYENYRSQFIQDEVASYPAKETPFSKNLRKVIEYRRKMLGAIDAKDQLFYNFSTAKFVESFAVAKNIFLKSEVSSEKGQFDILSENSCHSDDLQKNALDLFKPDISIQECLNLTAPFFGNLIKVTKNSASHAKNNN